MSTADLLTTLHTLPTDDLIEHASKLDEQLEITRRLIAVRQRQEASRRRVLEAESRLATAKN